MKLSFGTQLRKYAAQIKPHFPWLKRSDTTASESSGSVFTSEIPLADPIYPPDVVKDTMTPDDIIQVMDVHKSFLMGKEAVPALRGVTLNVRRGEMLCLMGPTGSGKTTLLNLIGGLDTASRGHILVDGEDVVVLNEESLAAIRLRLFGFIFQNFNLLSSFSALENVQVPMALAGRRDDERARELLCQVGLGDRLHHYPSELSGGQQQRTAIARALANDPPLLIGDEMTGDLDTKTSYEIMELLTQLNRQRGITIVYVTHDPRMAEFAHRVVHMQDGRLTTDSVTQPLPKLELINALPTENEKPVKARRKQTTPKIESPARKRTRKPIAISEIPVTADVPYLNGAVTQ